MTKKKIIFARLIAFLIIFVNVMFFASSIIEGYKKYTGSEALTAEVTGIESIKSENISIILTDRNMRKVSYSLLGILS